MPTEVTSVIAKRIQERRRTIVSDFGYLPTPEQHRLGGYETWIGVNKVQLDANPSFIAT